MVVESSDVVTIPETGVIDSPLIGGTSETIEEPMPESGDNGFKLSNNVILGIIIVACAVVGIVLGIISGRRAANK